MRKSFLTKEYTREPVAGTFNMKEIRFFYGGKILEIDDIITVDDISLFWQESEQGVQGLGLETIQGTLNTFDLKNTNHTLKFYQPQSDNAINEYTTWELQVNIKEIIRNYIFGELKRNRTFAGIPNENTKEISVNKAIYEYIDLNIFPRIKFKEVVIYLKYYDIGQRQDNVDTSGNPIIAQKNTRDKINSTFRDDILFLQPNINESNTSYQNRLANYKTSLRQKNYQLIVDSLEETAILRFKQTESNIFKKFDYYFDVIWVKS